jgi:serine/threonine-protein kinase
MGSRGSNGDSKQVDWAETRLMGSPQFGAGPDVRPATETHEEGAAGVTLPPSSKSPLLGTLVSGRYRLIEELGEGGMGAVYLAQHVALEKHVALKVLHPSLSRDPVLQERFLREAKAAARIDHKNVVNITDFGATNSGVVFIVMELLEGRDMAAVLKERVALPWCEARAILLQVCHALSAAHEHGVVHRDIKPENVFLLGRERENLIKVVDFGIAKLVHDRNQPKLTAAGVVHGTPGFIAPEQIQGGVVDHRADIYAVGALAYNIVTGRPPFAGKTVIQVLTLQMESNAVPPSQVEPGLQVPAALDAVLLRALAKDPEQRHGTMAELAAELEAVPAGEAEEGEPAEAGEPEDRLRLEIVDREPSDTTYKLAVQSRAGSMTIVTVVLLGLGVALAAGVGAGFLFLPASRPEVEAAPVGTPAVEPAVDSGVAPSAAADLSAPSGADLVKPAVKEQARPGAHNRRPRQTRRARARRTKKPAPRVKAPAEAKAPEAKAPEVKAPEPPPRPPSKKPPPKNDYEGNGELIDPYGD